MSTLEVLDNPEETKPMVVVAPDLFRKPHEKIADRFKRRLIDILLREQPQPRIKKYAASEEWGYDIEHLELTLNDEQMKLELTIKTKSTSA